MSVIAEFDIPAEEFALAETLENRPELTVHIDRVVAHNTTQVVPFVRVTQCSFNRDLASFLRAERDRAGVA